MMNIVDAVDVMGKEKMVWSTNVLPRREKQGAVHSTVVGCVKSGAGWVRSAED